MAVADLIGAVAAVLRSRSVVIIDEEMYHESIRDNPFDQPTAQNIAERLLCETVSRYATVEKFERGDAPGKVYLFVIAANSMEAWRLACRQLQNRIGQIINVRSEITTRVVIQHVFERGDPCSTRHVCS